MLNAVLNNPRSLFKLKRRWVRDVPLAVDVREAIILSHDSRFTVSGLRHVLDSDASEAGDFAELVEKVQSLMKEPMAPLPSLDELGLSTAEEARVSADTNLSLRFAEIVAAINSLDPDVESHYTEDGQPSAEAVSEIVGFPVSQDDILLTLRRQQARSTSGTLEQAEAPRRGSVRIVKRSKAKVEAPAPTVDVTKVAEEDKATDDATDVDPTASEEVEQGVEV